MSREISIFLDTNKFQIFWDNKKGANVFLNELGVRPEYYKLTRYIDDNGLQDKAEICIPEVVILEMKYHMKNGFSMQCQQLRDQIKEHKKVFGDLLDIDYEINKERCYETYIDSLFENFFKTPKNYAKQIPFPRQKPIMDTLINKAISGTRPFFAGKIGGKKYSDAGFKDSVIAETIFEYSRENDRLCIFVTGDQDFSTKFTNRIQNDSKFVLFSSIDEVIMALDDYYKINSVTHLMKEFTENTYWHEYLLNEAGIHMDESVTDREVENISNEDENIFIIKMSFIVNETKYIFFVRFDSVANEIIGYSYQIEDD